MKDLNELTGLNADALHRVSAAVAAAEKGTSGEIVPCVVEESDDYPEAVWIAGAAGAAVVASLIEALRWTFPELPYLTLTVQTTFPVAMGAALAAIVFLSRPLRRAIVGRHRRARRVHERATRAFVECGVFRTRDRTGVLILVSLFEREVVVLGDEGIAAKVTEADWNHVVQQVLAGLRRKDLGAGLTAAVTEVGVLLRRAGFTARPDDLNELNNGVIVPTKDPLR